MRKLDDNELWEKCKNGSPITTEDLGLKNLDDEPTYYTEGIKENDL